MLKNLFTLLFGNLSWNMPPWMRHLTDKAKTQPRTFWVRFAIVILALVAVSYGYIWYQQRPQPQLITAQINPPKIPPNEDVIVPSNLTLDFGLIANGLLNNKPVAPLNLINNTITTGVTIKPAIAGEWHWESDSHLVFTPEKNWPAGETYTIQFAKDFFTPNTKMASYEYSFTTLPFETLISEFKFYQDPLNPQIRQAVATINFSYPVDAASFEEKITLMWQASKKSHDNQHFKYTIKYDDNKRTAYLRSEPLPLPAMERYLALNLAKGIKPQAGPSTTTSEETATVLIPDAASYFKVQKATTAIVRNQQDRPEQVIILETSLGVTQSELNQSLHAYLLPKDYPATAAEQTKINYQWQDVGEITPAILALSTPLELKAIPADRDYATLHSYQYHAATPGFIYLQLDKGTRAYGDFKLTNTYSAVLSIPDYPQEISFLHKGALLALGSDEKLSVLVRGLNAVKFNIARVLPDDVNHLITQTGGDFSDPYFQNPAYFNQDNLSEIFSEVKHFDASDPAKQQYTALNLGQYLAKKSNNTGPLGLFLLQARGWNPANQTPLDVKANRLILITDIGLIAKDNADGTHDVFIQSISTGNPINHANVAILGKNGLPLLTLTTDAQGHVIFPTLTDFVDEREPVVYLVQNGNDVAFMPYNRADRLLNYSRFDIGGVTSQHLNQTALTAYVFSDRGIYRPGDTAHVAMIVKQPYVMPQPSGLPLEVTITDPRGVTVKDEKITLNDSGYLTLDFQTQATSPTGQYQVNLYIVKDNHPSSLIGNTTLKVAEFLPDRMRITTHLSPDTTQGWVSPSGLKAQVGLWNLYGAPATNHKVAGRILLTPKAVTFKEFPDYTFIDPLLNPNTPPKVFTDTLTDTVTNAQGLAEFDLKLDRFEKATYQLTVFTEGFESEGGRSVTAQTTALVSPLAYLVGYKADGDLQYIKQNDTRHIQFIAINPQVKQQDLSNLKIQLFNQHPVTTLVKTKDGSYQYQSIIQTTQISSDALTIPATGITYTLPTQQIGDFLLAIVDDQGRELSRLQYHVVGSGQQPIPKNAELNVTLNKSQFSAGEEIEMQITAPYTGAGLITIERDKVYAYQWFKAETTSSVQKIRIPANFQGNGYVNIAFVRDFNSPEIFMSPLSYSIQPFSVSHTESDIRIDLSTPETASPGQPFTITYQTDKPSKIIVFAVDEGILQVSRYQTPDPLDFFFQKQALEVNTQQILDQILPKFITERELSAVGGDEGEDALRKNLNPFKRKTDAPVVFWSGILDSDVTPRQLIYQLPDYFNGSLRVMAVAVATKAVGAATKTAQIRGDFVINPNVPTFVAPGDEFDITAGIANNVQGSGANARVVVTLNSTPQLEIIGDAKQTITIAEGQEQSVRFKVKAKDMLGSAELQLTATLANKTSHLSSTLSVRPATPYFTSVISGYSTDAKKSLPLDRILYPEYRVVEAALSPSPLILVAGLQNYLNQYPYGCTEQVVSKALPVLAMTNQPWFSTDTKAINDKVDQTIQTITQRQMSNGGFTYWPEMGTHQSNDFASVYAMHFLTEAKAKGYAVSSDVFSSGIGFLRELVTQDVTTLEQARLHAYAIYVLTRNEIVTTNYLTHLQSALDNHTKLDWQNDITSAYIASIYQILKNSTEAEKLIQLYKPANKNAQAISDFYNQSIGNAQYVYLVAKHFPSRLSSINMDIIMTLVNALNNDTMNTLLSGYTSLALATYNEFYSIPHDAALSISESLPDSKINALSSANGGLYQKVNIESNATQVNFINPDKQGYFYQLVQAGFDKTPSNHANNHGIEVYRELLDADNKVTDTSPLGNEITVRIRARAIDNETHLNTALVDLLPGGFEVVRDSVQLQNMDYVDVREDRVIYFGSLSSDSVEISYKIKATNKGVFTVPPMLGLSMYNPLVKSLGPASRITVN